MLVSLESPLVPVALPPLVLVMLVSLESPLVLVGLAPLVLVAPVNLVAHVAPAVQASQVDQQARVGLEGQAVQAGNQAARASAYDV